MCITKKELESKVQDYRSLKAMKAELEDELSAIERSIIDYMTENGIDTEWVEKLADILGDDLKPFEKVSFFNVLRVK